MDLPQTVKNTLWSYDSNHLDIQKDKNLIICNVLNWGTLEAVVWLRKTYSQEDILNSIKESNSNNWSLKSLNYWSKFFKILPKSKNRFV